MEDKNYITVIDYIAKVLHVKTEKVRPMTTLSDLGLDGDDVLDFLVGFFQEFDIDYKNTNYRDFIPPESGFFMDTIKSIFGLYKKEERDKIFIQDLVNSLEMKKWTKTQF